MDNPIDFTPPKQMTPEQLAARVDALEYALMRIRDYYNPEFGCDFLSFNESELALRSAAYWQCRAIARDALAR